MKRLKIKLRKNDKKILEDLETDYGNFMNCHSGHLKQILKTKDKNIKNFLPSIMILLMHLEKTRAYIKGFSTIGKLSPKLVNVQDQLIDIAKNYYNEYKSLNFDLIKLYEENPLDNEIMKQMRSKGITSKLHDISNQIKL